MASVANSTSSSGIASFPERGFLLRVEWRLRFPLPGRPEARECLSIRALWRALGHNCKPKLRSPSTQGAIISPIRLRNRSELANELDVSIKFGFVFKGAVRNSRSFVGSRSYRGIEQFHQARLVRITHRRLPVLLDPLGMLDPQVIVNLLQ